MSTGIRDHFSNSVMDYDTIVDSVVMKNNELHAELVRCVELPNDRPLRILDIGVGTGHGAGLVLAKYPSASLIGVDFSRAMLDKASNNLSAYRDRMELIEADIVDFSPAEKFDAVISAVTIHNLSSQEKRNLFEHLSNWIASGGLFVNADFYRGETEESDELIQEVYLDYVRSQLRNGELAAWIDHIENHDNPATLSEQSEMLMACKFETPKIEWQFHNEAVYWTRRR